MHCGSIASGYVRLNYPVIIRRRGRKNGNQPPEYLAKAVFPSWLSPVIISLVSNTRVEKLSSAEIRLVRSPALGGSVACSVDDALSGSRVDLDRSESEAAFTFYLDRGEVVQLIFVDEPALSQIRFLWRRISRKLSSSFF